MDERKFKVDFTLIDFLQILHKIYSTRFLNFLLSTVTNISVFRNFGELQNLHEKYTKRKLLTKLFFN